MKRFVDKVTLNNYLRHVDAHNKIQEEREMWRLRELERKSDYEEPAWQNRRVPLARGHLVSDACQSPERTADHRGSVPTSTYWTRQLMKYEENDPFRWGHSGFKEQHPEEFISTDEEEQADIKKSKTKSIQKKRPRTESSSSVECTDQYIEEKIRKKKKAKLKVKKDRKTKQSKKAKKR